MPRISRKSLETTFFHIVVQGIEKKYIFEKEVYKKKYLELMKEESQDYHIKILAFCIMDNHAHILINTDLPQNMSKFMHKINFKFGQFYNHLEDDRVGYVFRDRFSCEAIMDEKYLMNCIIYIHNNPVKANIVKCPSKYKYSSFNDYRNNNEIINYKQIRKLVDISLITKEESDSEYAFYDIERDSKGTIKMVTKEYKKKYKIDIIKPKKDKKMLKEIITNLKNNYNITYKEIGQELRISLSTIRRILKGNE